MSENPLPRYVQRLAVVALLLAGVLLPYTPSSGQGAKDGGKGKRPDFIPADYDDYRFMLTKLGIKKMRKGREGYGKDTSSEKTANRFKDSMPDLMTFKNADKVKSSEQWPKRRAEIVEDEGERRRLWDLADRVFPEYADYRERAGRAGRVIPIFQLLAR